jgi:lipoprotein-anchoring transpeptidase ErfK/SrfK
VPASRTSIRTAIAVTVALTAMPSAGFAQSSTTPGATTTTPAGSPPVVFPEGTIPAGVQIEGIDVSGLTALDARQRVVTQFLVARRAPMPVTFRSRQFTIDPGAVGYRADVDAAVIRAFQQAPAPGTTVDVDVVETISRAKLTTVLAWRATQFRVNGRDAVVSLRALQPVIRRAALGADVDVPRSVTLLAPAFTAPRPAAAPALPVKRVRPSVTSVGAVIVIDKSAFRLRLYRGTTTPGGTVMKRVRTYPIAIGQPQYPTPTGNFSVIVKQVNPTWFPPDSPWAAGLGPVSPGPGNPLGTRWIGTSAPAIGMHGTPNPSSIGTMASHGCIRMYMADVENLYARVRIGTPVFIRN